MSQRLPLLLALLFILTACGKEDDASGDVPGFVQLQSQVFEPGCAMSACHGGDSGIAGLTFADAQTAYDQLVNVPPVNGPARNDGLLRVTPGDVDASFLWTKLTMGSHHLGHSGYGAAMPMSTSTAPGPNSLDAIERWIEGGAPFDGADVEADTQDVQDFENYVECDAEDEAGLRECLGPEPDPNQALRIYSPKLVIPPNSDTTLCSYLDFHAPEEILLTATRGQQMSGGHHTAVFVASSPQNDFAPSDCGDAEMQNFRFVAAAGGGGGLDAEMPEGVALRIQQGQQIVLQSHYINTTDEPMAVMDSVDIEFSTDPDPIIADPFAMLDGGFEVPPGAEDFERVSECTADEDMDIYMLLGHTHENGVLFTFELLRDGEEPELLYHAVDGRLLRNSPEIKIYDTPLTINAGDSFRMTCAWDNPHDHALTWPEEMCVGLMYYGPGRGWLTCEAEDEFPRELGGGDAEGCADPTDEGNDVGVGRFCSSTECQDNGDANICLAAINPASNFCSFLGCETDDQCGEGASCVIESAGSACVPDKCL